ncbi:MAG: cellulase family glycosylhydrolase, partial [Bacteroidota bacterium]
ILDGQNNVIKLDGVNLGGWLMWEGWIWGGGFTAEKDINTNMQTIIGSTAITVFKDSVYKNFISRTDIQKISQQCFNVVRIPFNHTLLEDDFTPYVYKPEGWAVLDSVLKWCEDYNVYAVLDLHSAPGGQSTSFTADPDFLITLWNGTINQNRTKRLWKAIADRYKNRGIIAGYDILNEPNTSSGSDVLNLYNSIIDSIRSVDNNHMLFIEGNNYAQDFSIFTTLPDPNTCFEFHIYPWFFNNADSIAAHVNVYTSLSNALHAPIWCGEFGENDFAHLDTTLMILNNPLYKSSGTAFWTWKKIKQTLQYPYYYGIENATDWNKSITWICNTTSPVPALVEMQNGISGFINNIKFQNCSVDTTISNLLKVCTQTGFESLTKQAAFVVYPNPFTNTINIKSNGQKEFYELICSTGQIIWSGKQINEHDFSSLANGLYFLRIYNENSTHTTKLIKN